MVERVIGYHVYKISLQTINLNLKKKTKSLERLIFLLNKKLKKNENKNLKEKKEEKKGKRYIITEYDSAPQFLNYNGETIKADIYCFKVLDTTNKSYLDEWSLVYKDPTLDEFPLVRVQSQCVPGITFDDMECDCKQNLSFSKEMIINNPNGGIIFLIQAQEGRQQGGIAKTRQIKIRKTTSAILRDILEEEGSVYDERNYDFIPEALKIMGIQGKINIITRFPARVTDMEKDGIKINDVVGYPYYIDRYNLKYMAEKECVYDFNFDIKYNGESVCKDFDVIENLPNDPDNIGGV